MTILSPSNLETMTYGQQGWSDIHDANMEKLNSEWGQDSNIMIVDGFLAAQPGAPSDGDRYVATATAGDWTDNNIYTWSDALSAWEETVAYEGLHIYNIDDGLDYHFDGSDWISASILPFVIGAGVVELPEYSFRIKETITDIATLFLENATTDAYLRKQADDTLVLNNDSGDTYIGTTTSGKVIVTPIDDFMALRSFGAAGISFNLQDTTTGFTNTDGGSIYLDAGQDLFIHHYERDADITMSSEGGGVGNINILADGVLTLQSSVFISAKTITANEIYTNWQNSDTLYTSSDGSKVGIDATENMIIGNLETDKNITMSTAGTGKIILNPSGDLDMTPGANFDVTAGVDVNITSTRFMEILAGEGILYIKPGVNESIAILAQNAAESLIYFYNTDTGTGATGSRIGIDADEHTVLGNLVADKNLTLSTAGTGNIVLSPGGITQSYQNNASTTPQLLIKQDSTGDAALEFLLTGGQAYTIGIDNSASDVLKISPLSALDGTTYWGMDTAGNISQGVGQNAAISLYIKRSPTDTTGQNCIRAWMDLDVDNPGAYSNAAFNVVAYNNGAANNTGIHYGMQMTAISYNTAQLTALRAASIQYGMGTGGDTCVSSYGHYVQLQAKAGTTQTFTADYYAAAPAAGGTVTGEWFLYSDHDAPSRVIDDFQIAANNKDLAIGAAQQLTLTYDGTDGIMSTTSGDIILNPAGSVGVNTGATSPSGTFETAENAANNDNHMTCYSATPTQRSRFYLRKSASDTLGSIVATAADEHLGEISVKGVNNVPAYRTAAAIIVSQVGATDVQIGAKFEFSTAEKAGTLTNRLTIADTGDVTVETGDLQITSGDMYINHICSESVAYITSQCDTNLPYLRLRRARDNAGSPEELDNNDFLGQVAFQGYDGGGYFSGASISSQATEDWVNGSNRGADLFFKTVNAGATAITTQMKIDDDGGIFLYNLKAGANQAGAGAAADELYHDTDDNTIKIGV